MGEWPAAKYFAEPATQRLSGKPICHSLVNIFTKPNLLQDDHVSEEETVSSMETSLVLPGPHASSDEGSLETDPDDDDDSTPPFDYGDSVAVFDEWVSLERRESRQMFAVRLMDLLIHEHGYLKTKAAEEAANVVQVNERTVRRWHKDFYEHNGQLTEDGRGRYERLCILSDENCQKKALSWVRANAFKKGEPVMTAADFLMGELLPTS